MKLTLRFVLGLLLLVAPIALATGSRLAGTWKSTNGNLISIPSTPDDFDLIIKHVDGHKELTHAHWTSGMVGIEFWFESEKGVKVVCTYNRGKDQVRTVNTKNGKENWWVRVN